MATIKPSHAFAKKCFDRFRGLGNQGALEGDGATEMLNLRINEDGSLCSREGYRIIARFPDQRIRGFWEGVLDHQTYRFIAAGGSVYLMDLKNQIHTKVGTIASADESVEFFSYENRLYLLDGEDLLVYQPSSKSFIAAEPYVPLIGYQWHPTDFGDIYEPVNLLTPRMRVRYLNTSASTAFYLPFYAKSVEAVYVNGTRTRNVTLCEGGKYVEVPSAANASQIDVVMTADFADDTALPIRRARHALVQRFGNAERLFLYGTDGTCAVYPAASVNSAMLNICHVLLPSVLPLYFKSSDVLYLGSRENPVQALFPYHGEILAFGTHQTFRIFTENNVSFEAESLADGIGCSSHGMAFLCEASPVLADSGGLTWLESTSRTDSLRSRRIRYPTLRPPLKVPDTATAVWNPNSREILIRDPAESTGKVLVYQADRNDWYCFDNIAATLFFSISGHLGFGTENGNVYLFDDSCTTDDGTLFRCRYQSTYFDFGTPETVRRALRLSVCGNLHGGEATLRLTDERRESDHALRGNSKHTIEHFELRRKNGRYRFLRFSLEARSDCKVELYKLSFFTNL